MTTRKHTTPNIFARRRVSYQIKYQYLFMFLGLVTSVISAKSLHRRQTSRIFGGQPARQGQFPYQLEVIEHDTHYCGASLVQVKGIQVAISAAHCFSEEDPSSFRVVAGVLDREVSSSLEQVRSIERIEFHPNYNATQSHNDIAILCLNESFTLNKNVRLIPLPSQNQSTDGNLTVTGWGNWTFGDTGLTMLQYVEIPVVANDFCKMAYSNSSSHIVPSQICAGESTGKKSPCNGDSGGSAASQEGYLAGIVSFGIDCGHPDFPSVYTRVSHFVDWIEFAVPNWCNRTNLDLL